MLYSKAGIAASEEDKWLTRCREASMMQVDCKRKGRSNYSTAAQRFLYFIRHDSEGGEKLQ